MKKLTVAKSKKIISDVNKILVPYTDVEKEQQFIIDSLKESFDKFFNTDSEDKNKQVVGMNEKLRNNIIDTGTGEKLNFYVRTEADSARMDKT